MLLRAGVVYAITFVLIVARRLRWLPIGRPAGALVGACLAVASRVLTPDEAYASIDHGTIVLLFSMMLVNVHLERAGAFMRLAGMLGKWPRTARGLTYAVAVGSGVGSALLVNDAVCLMGTPVVLALARRRGVHPLPFLLALALGANVGGVMTLTGTPQCMIVGQLGHISYPAYAAVMVPLGALCLGLLCLVLRFTYREEPSEERIVTPDREAESEPELLRPALFALALITVGFVLRFDLAWTALVGACVLVVMARRELARLLNLVDWSVLLFFCGLFVVVGGLRHAGAGEKLLSLVGPWLSGPPSHSTSALAAASVVGSNIVSNVPLVLLVGPSLDRLPNPRLLWLTLSMASTFAGNLTLLGSVANIIVSETAGERGGMTFRAYLRVGLPVTVLTTVAGVLALLAMNASGYLALTQRL